MRIQGIEIAFVLSVLAGCAASSTEVAPPAAPAAPAAASSSPRGSGMMAHHAMGGETGAMAAMCPMEVKDTTARAEDVEGGAALVFTTTGDVNELRSRVSRMAEMHNQHHASAQGPGMGMHGDGASPGASSEATQGDHSMHHEGMMGGGMMGGGMMGGGMVPASTARTEEIEGGARLVLTPKDPADLGKLRDHVKQHAEKMASGQCPMMTMHPMHPS